MRVDGASPRGLWPPAGGRLCRRVVKGKVLKMDGPSAQGFLSLPGLRAEGCGGSFAASFIKKGRGWRRGLCRRVASLRSGGNDPSGRGLRYRPEGDEYEVSVTDLPFCIIRHEKHSADWLAALTSPYPAAPDFSTGKRVTRFSGRSAPLRIVFPCHPCSGGRIDFYASLQRHGSMAKHP